MTLRLHKTMSFPKTAGLWLRCFLGARRMTKVREVVSALVVFLCSSLLFGQSICSDANGRHTPLDPKIRLCIDERDGPNLFIDHPVKLTGSLYYENCAPTIDKEVFVRVSDPSTKRVLFSSALDEKGQFDFGAVPAGKYRISAVLRGHGVWNRLSVAGRSADFSCSDGSECKLQVMIWWKQTNYQMVACSQK